MSTESDFELFFQNSLDLLVFIGFDNRFKLVSPSFEKILGWKKEEVISEPFQDFLHPDDRERSFAEAKAHGIGKGAISFENRYLCKDGSYRWISWNSHIIPEKQIVFGIGRDITERKKAEIALKESEDKYRLIVETTNEGVWVAEPNGKATFVNQKMADMLGYSKEEILGHVGLEFLDKQQEAQVIKNRDVLHSNKSLQVECKFTRKDGSLLWTIANTVPIHDREGKHVANISMHTDITERKKAEEKLEEYQKNLEKLVEERTRKLALSSLYARNLIEASLDPLVTISAKGKITDVNKATEIATGRSRDELIGSDFFDYFVEPEKAKIGYKRVFAEGIVKDYPLAIMHKNGRITNVLYNATVYRNNAGEIQGVFAAARDITEQKKAEAEAQEAEKKLKNSERLAAIGATAGMVGHDIRNPLQAIIGDLYLLKDEVKNIPDGDSKLSAEETIDAITDNINYINKIVSDLQDYARPLKPTVQQTDLTKTMTSLLEHSNIPKNIETRLQIQSEVNQIASDADLLKRIFTNLITNAAQAMPKGGKLTITATKTSDNFTAISVGDTGFGIPQEFRANLFTPTFTTKSKGQGFGLAVVKRLTESLGGTVSFESEVGKGTTFTVCLPPQRVKR